MTATPYRHWGPYLLTMGNVPFRRPFYTIRRMRGSDFLPLPAIWPLLKACRKERVNGHLRGSPHQLGQHSQIEAALQDKQGDNATCVTSLIKSGKY
jgi:hypothetical protein